MLVSILAAASVLGSPVTINDYPHNPLLQPTDEDCYQAGVVLVAAAQDDMSRRDATAYSMFFIGRLSTLPDQLDWVARGEKEISINSKGYFALVGLKCTDVLKSSFDGFFQH